MPENPTGSGLFRVLRRRVCNGKIVDALHSRRFLPTDIQEEEGNLEAGVLFCSVCVLHIIDCSPYRYGHDYDDEYSSIRGLLNVRGTWSLCVIYVQQSGQTCAPALSDQI